MAHANSKPYDNMDSKHISKINMISIKCHSIERLNFRAFKVDS